MATIVLGAVGTLLGGPVGGAIGSLLGSAADRAILGPRAREGSRLSELKITTSSYGVAIPRHFGRMRVSGQIIWSTDLVEHKEKQGGGKGSPAVTTYSYSASFAVALSSRPLVSIGRIWADGQLLRGAAGDLKVGGRFRFYPGFGNQEPDPLIAAAEGAARCPAYRGTAYAVFEDLALSDFGNRIPSLSFEVFAETGQLTLADLLEDAIPNSSGPDVLEGIAGLSVEGPLSDTIATLQQVIPIAIAATGSHLMIGLAAQHSDPAIVLAEAAATDRSENLDRNVGPTEHHWGAQDVPPRVLRYYDIDRDFQPGTQQASGPGSCGQPRSVELPASLYSGDARQLVEQAARRADWAGRTITWRVAQLDPAVVPGAQIMLPDRAGIWRVVSWEWRDNAIDLLLARIPSNPRIANTVADPGRASCAADDMVEETVLTACELPWDGTSVAPQVLAIASSTGAGWRGAALYLDRGNGTLEPLGATGRARGSIGSTVDTLPRASPLVFDRRSSLDIVLVPRDLVLANATIEQLATGVNRAVVGEEIVQFAKALALGNGRWRLSGFWRGLGGTENAVAGHKAGEDFILLDGVGKMLDPVLLGSVTSSTIAALGVADPSPVYAAIRMQGIAMKPLTPVHGRWLKQHDGAALLTWIRRARGGWIWRDGVDTPLGETIEAYEVTFATPDRVIRRWETNASQLALSAAEAAEISAAAPQGRFSIRQRGDQAMSDILTVVVPQTN